MNNAWKVGIAFLAILVVVSVGSLLIRQYGWTWPGDRRRISEEAEEQHCSILSISWAWFPLFHGPFAWEWYPRGSRFYVVACRDQSGAERVAYVLIGPERFFAWDFYGRLTWRWVKKW